MSLEAYEGPRRSELLLERARGEKEIAAGAGHSLDDVLAEAESPSSKD
ncbi:MAG: hypothetical protein U0790_08000 [Isosphaeraceae bacterium]